MAFERLHCNAPFVGSVAIHVLVPMALLLFFSPSQPSERPAPYPHATGGSLSWLTSAIFMRGISADVDRIASYSVGVPLGAAAVAAEEEERGVRLERKRKRRGGKKRDAADGNDAPEGRGTQEAGNKRGKRGKRKHHFASDGRNGPLIQSSPATKTQQQQQEEEEKGQQLSPNLSLKRYLDVKPCSVSRLFSPLKKAAASSPSPSAVWQPPPRRFLFLDCHEGPLSTRLICFQHHLLLAGLLSRTLIIDRFVQRQVRGNHTWALAVDLPHLTACYGANALITFDEYLLLQPSLRSGSSRGVDIEGNRGSVIRRRKRVLHAGARSLQQQRREHKVQKDEQKEQKDELEQGAVYVDEVFCWFSDKSVLWKNMGRRSDVKLAPGLQFANFTSSSSWDEIASFFSERTSQVLLVGDLWKAALTNKDTHSHFAAFGDSAVQRAPSCRNGYVLRPPAEVVALADEFIAKRFEGRRYLAVHLRRRTGKEICVGKTRPDCSPSIEEIGGCLWRKMTFTGMRDVFFFTDGKDLEIRQLRYNLDFVDDKEVQIIDWEDVNDRIVELFPNNFQEILTLFNMIVSAKATIFQASLGESLSLAIERMRYQLGTARCHDSCLCDDILASDLTTISDAEFIQSMLP